MDEISPAQAVALSPGKEIDGTKQLSDKVGKQAYVRRKSWPPRLSEGSESYIRGLITKRFLLCKGKSFWGRKLSQFNKFYKYIFFCRFFKHCPWFANCWLGRPMDPGPEPHGNGEPGERL